MDSKHGDQSPSRANGITAAGFNRGHKEQARNSSSHREARTPWHPQAIPELFEPPLPNAEGSIRPGTSALTAMIQDPQARGGKDSFAEDSESASKDFGVRPVTVSDAIILQPSHETIHLLQRAARQAGKTNGYGSITDVEGQLSSDIKTVPMMTALWRDVDQYVGRTVRTLKNPKSWSGQDVWTTAVKQPATYIPPVILGLLLNILDALSYGENVVRNSSVVSDLSQG